MINIYDNVNAVADDLRETAQYKTLRDAIAAVDGEPEAKEVFSRFQHAQGQINQAVQAGTEPDESQVTEWQEIANEMEKFDSLKQMLAAEKGLNQLLMEINNIITKPIAELYGQN
ncbi:YlbF family regulator [Weissella sagaensis]|jgi:cell fate (sporulation/competence/biofilm development) regulator YlbF (YheA/YmcA/DUF963 family)|uniref:YlbF family regulator n=1 Tax=Weissella sagaensis TaxID=2559928 RepID=A0ABW1RST6_9LACO|nr:YlbF family regulator [Weissella sagaensis]KAA8432945.1 hypothetical protein FKV79_07040 [Weissella paramesenteroides]MBU7567722.1 YlbF family regulator [Weissella hellenica]KAA8436371.1 hypothetical protein FKV73_08070 [Weissella paramesenteroides]QDJ58608.1 hypothetical protein EFA59_03345 [Weissella hellenica]QEA57548.1 hypothetical protein FGL75_06570 [Weissella hellenica]